MQSQVPPPLNILSYYTFTVLLALSALHQAHASQTPTLQLQNPWLSHLLQPQHLEQFSLRHQALLYSLFLQRQTQDISLLRILLLSSIVLQPYQSVQCVCVCVCVCVCMSVSIFHIVMLDPLSMSALCKLFAKLLITVPSWCTLCVLLCLFSALSLRVGTLQISIIVTLTNLSK